MLDYDDLMDFASMAGFSDDDFSSDDDFEDDFEDDYDDEFEDDFEDEFDDSLDEEDDDEYDDPFDDQEPEDGYDNRRRAFDDDLYNSEEAIEEDSDPADMDF